MIIKIQWTQCIAVAIVSCLMMAPAVAQNSPAEKYVKTFSLRKNAWLIQKQYDSLQQIIDPRCLYVHSNGWEQSATEIVTDIQSGKLEYKRIVVADMVARQFDKMVIVTGQGNFEGVMNGTAFALNLRFTEVYINRKMGWKLVSRHASKISD